MVNLFQSKRSGFGRQVSTSGQILVEKRSILSQETLVEKMSLDLPGFSRYSKHAGYGNLLGGSVFPIGTLCDIGFVVSFSIDPDF